MLSKSSEAAIAAMSRLAEVYAEGTPLTAAQLAESRNLQKPFVAKLLTVLSQADLITGVPGPGGGYRLASHPSEITLLDIANCFERKGEVLACPFGPGYCGDGPHCPIHDDIVAIREHANDFMNKTTLDVFCRSSDAGCGKRPTKAQAPSRRKR